VPEGESGSSTIRVRLLASGGVPVMISDGLMFSPSQVKRDGID
jgi:hypothetical protein